MLGEHVMAGFCFCFLFCFCLFVVVVFFFLVVVYFFFAGKIPQHSHVSREPAVWGEGVIEERWGK